MKYVYRNTKTIKAGTFHTAPEDARLVPEDVSVYRNSKTLC